MINLVLLIFALVLLLLATLNVPAKFNLVAAALALYILSLLLSHTTLH